MVNNSKVIVSMSSWKKRIHSVAQAIAYFLSTQTVKPDLFYLTLSEEEFPCREYDLPVLLNSVIKQYGVTLVWQKENNQIFKRYSVYPKHYSDFVMIVDDDTAYPPTLLQDALSVLSVFPNTICHLNRSNVSVATYSDSCNLVPDFSLVGNIPVSPRFLFCGQCCIPPYTFPLDALDDNLKYLRQKFAFWNDEPWLTAFLIRDNISISYVPRLSPHKMFQGSQIVNNENVGMSNYFDHFNLDDGHPEISFRSKMNYIMLRKLNMIGKYKTIFPKYNCDILDNCDYYKDI